MNPTSIKLGVYEHYKSTAKDRRYYQVISVAQHTERDELLVVYVPLYTDPQYAGSWLVRARPADEFLGTVDVGGRLVDRYKYVGVL